jgi:Periplasmic binding protein
MVRGWRKVAFVASLSGLLVAASACGDDDDSASDETEAPAAETTAAPDTTEAVTDTTEAMTDTTAGGGEVEQTITVGFAWADLSVFAEVNEAFGVGDPEEQILAVSQALHDSGALPVNGVDVEFVTGSFSAIASEERITVCQQFGQEDQVFAALGGRDFAEGAECLASRFNVPTIGVNQAAAAAYAQAGPNFFTVKPDEETILTSFANWALENGYLEGKTIGLYWESQASAAVEAMKAVLAEAGITIASEVESTGQGEVGAQQDALAAQRFQADGVDLVIPIVGSSSIINFTSAAAEQGYTPGYIDMDWASHLSDVATAAYAPGQYADVPALASVRAGDLSVGLNEEAEQCLSDFEAFSGKSIERTSPEQSGEFTNILITCDLANLMVEALRIATADGAELTQESYRAAIEQIDGFSGAYWDSIGYSADDHSGADTGREVRWNPDCPCWEPEGEFAPLPR